MKSLMRTLAILIILMFVSCDDSNDNIDFNEADKLIGAWINPITIDTDLKFERANSLKENQYGIAFYSENQYVERSSGWCGTPPITFFDTKGVWLKKESTIDISTDNGLMNVKWKIKLVDDNYLIIERLN